MALRGALVGAGLFAGYQAEAWQRVPEADLIAVVDSDPDRATAFASEWGIPRCYSDVDAALEAEAPDFLDIAARPEMHLDLATRAAAHGVHVLCQTPLALDWDACATMVEICRRAKVRLLVHDSWRWQPWYREIARLLAQGAVGTPFYAGFRIRTGDARGPQPFAAQPQLRAMRRFLILETGAHFLDTFRYLLGDIAQVLCRTRRLNPALDGEDCALIELDFASGVLGLIDANRHSGPAVSDPAMGTLWIEGHSGTLRLAPDGTLWRADPGRPEQEHRYPWSRHGYRGDSVLTTQQHLAQCLATGDPCETEGEAYLATVAAVFACYRSAETGAAEAAAPPGKEGGPDGPGDMLLL